MTQAQLLRNTSQHLPEDLNFGLGTWAWGDKIVWGFGGDYGSDDVRDAFRAAIDAGIRLFDTAEIYGQGESERLLGQFMAEMNVRPMIATKFAPLPWRLNAGSLVDALRASLERLRVGSVDLYQVHFPAPPVSVETWADALADVVDMGLAKAVGVSNFNAEQTQRTYDVLARRGVALASNQVEYSLIERKIERDGTMKVCNDLGVRVIAYSPIGMGLLTGKYSASNPPSGARAWQKRKALRQVGPLVTLLREIGEAHGKTPAQVAINWTICQGTLPIPGAKTVRQVQSNAEARGWRLTADELAALDRESLLAGG
jgi:aryl-alcohol dehydrogenase-like predicted oxidoreductase